MKNDNANIPDNAGNVGFNTQLTSHIALSICRPHDADFIKTNIIIYIIDTVPEKYKLHVYDMNYLEMILTRILLIFKIILSCYQEN